MRNAIEILLINADTRERDIFSFALNDLPVRYNCRFAWNIKDAIKKLRTVIPDYIFIDLKDAQPGISICLEQIKKMTGVKDTRVIVCSDDSTDISAEKALQSGAFMCINKTAIISDLIHALKKIFLRKPIHSNMNNG